MLKCKRIFCHVLLSYDFWLVFIHLSFVFLQALFLIRLANWYKKTETIHTSLKYIVSACLKSNLNKCALLIQMFPDMSFCAPTHTKPHRPTLNHTDPHQPTPTHTDPYRLLKSAHQPTPTHKNFIPPNTNTSTYKWSIKF